MLRLILPAAVVLFLAVSFGFLGGWPFRHSAPDAALSKEAAISSDESRDDGAGSDTAPAPVAAAPQERPVSQPATSPAVEAEALAGLENRDPDEFRHQLARRVLDPLVSAADRQAFLVKLRERNRRDLFVPTTRLRGESVVVGAGDSLSRIASAARKRSGVLVTPALIQLVNGLTSDRIRRGATLVVPLVSTSIEIRKSDFRLYLRLGEEILLDFPVGLGKNDGTPVGSFQIQGKTKEPRWTRPDGKVVPFGDPSHLIGSRWMGFTLDGKKTSYGIHGTVDAASIGKSESDGCVRLLNADVEALFDLVPEGAEVRISP